MGIKIKYIFLRQNKIISYKVAVYSSHQKEHTSVIKRCLNSRVLKSRQMKMTKHQPL